MEITFILNGVGALKKLPNFIKNRVKPLKEKYPYAEIRIEVRL